MITRRVSVTLALLLPAIISVMIVIIWDRQGVNPITGDEPHYLLITDSLLRDGDLRVGNNYLLDTLVRRALPGGGAPLDAHTQGSYSIHGPGLPALLIPGYALGGVLGAKIELALLVGLLPLSVYRRALAILPDSPWPLSVALIVGLGQPFLIGGGQIYPDLLAGLILFELLGAWDEGAAAPGWWAGGLLALLPWLHLKLLAPAALLALLYARRTRAPTLLLAASAAGLGLYNLRAFGSILGPYQPGDATSDIGRVAMVALGLHMDRMQGIFVQAPIFLLGLLGLASLVAERRRLALAAGAIALLVLLPSAAHTNWYGGTSFAGRFFWAVAPLWCFPLLFAIRLLRRRGLAALAVGALAGAILLESVFVAKVLIPNAYTYTAPPSPAAAWMDSDPYADFLDLTPMQRARWLPSFQEPETAARTPANWIFGGLIICLTYTGGCALRGRPKACMAAWGTFLIAAACAAWLVQPDIRPATLGAELELRRGAGYVAAGPRGAIQPGRYALALGYAAGGPARWECALVGVDGRREALAAGELAAGDGELRASCAIPRASDRAALFELRLYG
ncbi:hypothetical protein K2Z83_00630, partial [Oscillochloris sp. ZM17-4]|uniref:hypothetical protein n=1 Tax=Oscillochloris sp. ZM17-4 TaxID=2866714 RepID=UPI001C72F3A4